VKPKQSKDNPFDIIDRRAEWVQFEYDKGRGSRMDLVDYAKRFALMHAILRDCNRCGVPAPPDSIVNAMKYLLNMGGECES
jgi:hypothetical protein